MRVGVLVFLAAFVCGCQGQPAPPESSNTPIAVPSETAPPKDDLTIVDDYLRTWDNFACAESQEAAAPYQFQLNSGLDAFEEALTRLLEQGDKRAPARLVFYAVVQVGGGIPADSRMGKAALKVLGPEFPVLTTKSGEKALFAADLYFWWERHGQAFTAYPLMEEWLSREFARETVLPAYRKMKQSQPRKPE